MTHNAGDSGTFDTARLRKRLDRERRTRLEAEAISEHATRTLYRRQKELELLQAITVAANQATAVDDALQCALDGVCEHTGWPVGHAFLVSPDGSGELEPMGIWNSGLAGPFAAFREITESTSISRGTGLPGRVLASRQPAWIEDIIDDGDFPRAKTAMEIGVRTGFAFPILTGMEVVAVLEFFADRPEKLDSELLAVMAQVGTQLGRVIERRRAEEKLQQQFRRLNLLNQINQSIAEWQDLNSLVNVVLRQLEDHLSIDLGAVLLHDEPTDTLTVTTVQQKTAPPFSRLEITKGTVISVETSGLRAAVGGQTVSVPDTASMHARLFRQLRTAGFDSVLAVPLIVRSRVTGLLLVGRGNGKTFDSGESEFLRMLGTHVAVASYQARMHVNLRNAYDELRQTQQAVMQQERLRALGQMASGIAHDINNTLSPIVGYADLLLDKEIDPELRRYIGRIKTAGEDASQIVARLREFYRHREKNEVLASVDVNERVREVLELTRPRWRDIQQAKGLGIHVEMQLPDGLPGVIGNATEMREALTNLVFNAIDAMPQGGTLTVRTRLVENRAGHSAPTPRSVAIEVCDTGIGMDEDTRRHCMEPFFTTKGERGTGLGLSMVYGIMERHKGTMEIDSRLGVGTTVRLILPVRDAPVAKNVDSTAEARILPARILYIDDEPLLRELVKSLLDIDEHDVAVAEDGEAGVEAFRDARKRGEPFDVVITDLGMPRMDGRQVAESIKTDSPETPVIMMTGWGLMIQSSGECPPFVDAIISKPARLDELRKGLLKVLPGKAHPDTAPPS